MKNQSKLGQIKLGFSLIELSVVILVIGILVIGVTQGSRIMAESKLKSARSLTDSSPVNSINNLVLWIDSTSSKSFNADIANDSEVASWYDLNIQSANKHNFTQSNSGEYPLYKINLYNNLPGVVFDGFNHWISTPHHQDLNPNAGGSSVFFVSKVLSTSTGFHYITKGNGNSTTIGWSYNSRQFRFRSDDLVNGGSSNTFPATMPDKIPKIATVIFFGTEARYYKNNTEQTPRSTYTGSINSGSDLTIGARAGGTVNSNIEVYELIIFNRLLSAGEITSIHEYLSQKWGIKIS